MGDCLMPDAENGNVVSPAVERQDHDNSVIVKKTSTAIKFGWIKGVLVSTTSSPSHSTVCLIVLN